VSVDDTFCPTPEVKAPREIDRISAPPARPFGTRHVAKARD